MFLTTKIVKDTMVDLDVMFVGQMPMLVEQNAFICTVRSLIFNNIAGNETKQVCRHNFIFDNAFKLPICIHIRKHINGQVRQCSILIYRPTYCYSHSAQVRSSKQPSF